MKLWIKILTDNKFRECIIKKSINLKRNIKENKSKRNL